MNGDPNLGLLDPRVLADPMGPSILGSAPDWLPPPPQPVVQPTASAPSPQASPGLLERMASGLFPAGQMGSLLDPELLKQQQRQQLTELGLGLLSASGPRPQGTSSFMSDLGNVLSNQRQGWQQRLNQTFQNTVGLMQMQRDLRARAAVEPIVEKYRLTGSETPQEAGVKIAQLLNELMPYAVQSPSVAELVRGLPATITALQANLGTRFEMQKYANTVQGGQQAFTDLQKAGLLPADQAYEPGRASAYIEQARQALTPQIQTREAVPGKNTVQQAVVPATGEVKWSREIPGTAKPVPQQWTVEAEQGASALVAFKELERLRQTAPNVEAEVGRILVSPDFVKAIPGFKGAADISAAAAKANASPQAQTYLRRAWGLMDSIIRTRVPGSRLSGAIFQTYANELLPGLDPAGFGAMRGQQLQAILAAQGQSGYDQNPDVWNNALKRHGMGAEELTGFLQGPDERLTQIRSRY